MFLQSGQLVWSGVDPSLTKLIVQYLSTTILPMLPAISRKIQIIISTFQHLRISYLKKTPVSGNINYKTPLYFGIFEGGLGNWSKIVQFYIFSLTNVGRVRFFIGSLTLTITMPTLRFCCFVD